MSPPRAALLSTGLVVPDHNDYLSVPYGLLVLVDDVEDEARDCAPGANESSTSNKRPLRHFVILAGGLVPGEFGPRERLAMHLVGAIPDPQKARLGKRLGEEEIL